MMNAIGKGNVGSVLNKYCVPGLLQRPSEVGKTPEGRAVYNLTTFECYTRRGSSKRAAMATVFDIFLNVLYP